MKKHLLTLLIILSSLPCFSQGGPWKKRKQIEYSGFFDSYFWRGPFNYYLTTGTSVYYGDLSSQLKYNQFKPAIGIGANYNMWSRVLLGVEFQYLGLGATDEIPERNLKFKSNNLEFTGYARFEILYDRILKHTERNKKPKLIKPYLFGGISMVRYSATATSNGPGTGDTLPVEPITYPRWTLAIPTGLGIKFSFSHRFAISTQLNYRITFTDYLDQVSELRGSAEKNDTYTSFNVLFEFTPGARPRKKKPKPSHGESSTGASQKTSSDSTKTNSDPSNTEINSDEQEEDSNANDVLDENDNSDQEDNNIDDNDEIIDDSEDSEESDDDNLDDFDNSDDIEDSNDDSGDDSEDDYDW